MDEQTGSAGLSRRDVLKRSAVVGGLVWVAPTVLASPAGATPPCPPAQRYAIKHDGGRTCETPGTEPSEGNCAASAGFTLFNDGCCLEPGPVTFTESSGGATHTYVLAAGRRLRPRLREVRQPVLQPR